MNTLGERIVFLREEYNISQKELAAKIQITAATLSRYENNLSEPNADILCRLVSALHTSSDFLLGLCDSYDAIKKKGSAKSLSAKEYSLLKQFRSLTPDNQIRAEERIETLFSLQKS